MATMMTTNTKIVLYTFPPIPKSYSMTPFGLKTESFLRANDIPYEKVYTTSFGNNGTIPYLRIFSSDDESDESSFEEIPDSNAILSRLSKDPRFEIRSDANLTTEQKAIGHACLRMLEEHTSQAGFYFRYALKMPEFCEATQLRERVFMGDESKLGNFIYNQFKSKMPKGWMKKAKVRGFVRYSSPAVVWAMTSEDLKVLEDLLSQHVYFFGQSHPGTLDCTVFGHLSQFLYIDIDFPQKKYLKESCPNLLRFMEHFKTTHFPDWETLCLKQPNDALDPDNPRMKALAKMKQKAILVGATALLAIVGVGGRYFSSVFSSSQEL